MTRLEELLREAMKEFEKKGAKMSDVEFDCAMKVQGVLAEYRFATVAAYEKEGGGDAIGS